MNQTQFGCSSHVSHEIKSEAGKLYTLVLGAWWPFLATVLAGTQAPKLVNSKGLNIHLIMLMAP